MLTEANPFEGIEEKLGNSIYEFTLTTGSEISKSQGQKNSMVAIRAIVEAMGGTIDWEQISQQITLTARGNTVKMWLNRKTFRKNGK